MVSENDLQVFEFIKTYIAKHGTPPSTRDIATALNIPSTNTVQRRKLALQEAGYISFVPRVARSIVVLKDD